MSATAHDNPNERPIEKGPSMKKDLGAVQAVFPMPVLVIAAYDAGGTIQTMNAA